MEFDEPFILKLINTISDNFIDLHMSSEFMALSKETVIMIARKRLWLLLRNVDEKALILNKKECGLLSIFDHQAVLCLSSQIS